MPAVIWMAHGQRAARRRRSLRLPRTIRPAQVNRRSRGCRTVAPAISGPGQSGRDQLGRLGYDVHECAVPHDRDGQRAPDRLAEH